MSRTHDDRDALVTLETKLAEDLLDPAVPREAVEATLRASGIQPDDLRTEGRQLVSQLLERRRLAWQETARRRIAKRAPILARVAEYAAMTKDELLRRLNELRAAPHLGAPVAAAFRKRQPEESTPEELRSLLEEVELLRDLQAAEDDEGRQE